MSICPVIGILKYSPLLVMVLVLTQMDVRQTPGMLVIRIRLVAMLKRCLPKGQKHSSDNADMGDLQHKESPV